MQAIFLCQCVICKLFRKIIVKFGYVCMKRFLTTYPLWKCTTRLRKRDRLGWLSFIINTSKWCWIILILFKSSLSIFSLKTVLVWTIKSILISWKWCIVIYDQYNGCYNLEKFFFTFPEKTSNGIWIFF